MTDIQRSEDKNLAMRYSGIRHGDHILWTKQSTVAPSDDIATPPVETITSPVEMATPPVNLVTPLVNLATPPVNLATPPVNLATPPANLATPHVGTATPTGSMATPPTNTGSPSPNAPTLLTIPGEVRNQIYSLLFAEPLKVRLGDKNSSNDRDFTSQSSQILETCHQIYNEAVSYAYQDVTLRIDEGHGHKLEEVKDFKWANRVKVMTIDQRLSPALLDVVEPWLLKKFTGLQSCGLSATVNYDVLTQSQFYPMFIEKILLKAACGSRPTELDAEVRLCLCVQLKHLHDDDSGRETQRVRAIHVLTELLLWC